jgi:hypothetical protein
LQHKNSICCCKNAKNKNSVILPDGKKLLILQLNLKINKIMVDQSIFYQPDQIALHLALAKQLSSQTRTKEEAFANLKDAGILDENGEFAAPYSNLGRIVNKLSKQAE